MEQRPRREKTKTMMLILAGCQNLMGLQKRRSLKKMLQLVR